MLFIFKKISLANLFMNVVEFINESTHALVLLFRNVIASLCFPLTFELLKLVPIFDFALKTAELILIRSCFN